MVLPVVATIIAALALVMSVISLYRTVRHERTRHVDRISIFYEQAPGTISEDHHSEIVVRNDGDTAAIIEDLGMAYGDWYITDRDKPHLWTHVGESDQWLLPPGGERRVPAPDDPSGVGVLGPICFVIDTNGRRWQRMTAHRVRIELQWRPPSRRGLWAERQRWFEKLDGALGAGAVSRLRKRPGRFPLVALLIDAAWGWRMNDPTKELLPLNAPLGWRYAMQTFALPDDKDSEPHYAWKER